MLHTRMLVGAAGGLRSPYGAAMTRAHAEAAHAFHRSFPQYEPTPLVALPALAGHLKLGAVMVKDESARFGVHQPYRDVCAPRSGGVSPFDGHHPKNPIGDPCTETPFCS